MDIIKFFDSDEMELPRERGEIDFEEFLSKLFIKYMDNIDNLTGDDRITRSIIKNKECIKETCDSIEAVISKYLDGFPSQAFSELETAIDRVRKYFSILEATTDISKENLGKKKIFYRMRLRDEKIFKRREMFHIPFKLRHVVQTQRYSIPGLPCLYLGSSIHVCWKEMGQPGYSQIQASRLELKPNSNVYILDFGYRPALIAAMIDHFGENLEPLREDFAIAHAVCWPIIAACSIVVPEKNSSFKVEYIVPQLIMQWIMAHMEGSWGVRYFSMQITEYYDSPRLNQNYAFPATVKSKNGLCKNLESIFKISEPVDYRAIIPEEIKWDGEINRNMPQEDIRLTKALCIPYPKTDLGYFEAAANDNPLFSLDE